MNRISKAALAAALLLAACREEAAPPLYEPVAVARRDITVAAEAAGTVEPILVVEVKSKASGEITDLRAETGDIVQQGELLVQVDPREPRNQVAQAVADTAVARAQLANAESHKRRAEDLRRAELISEQEFEQANLTFANARAALVRAERALQLAEIQLQDTEVRAPITGTIIEKTVERGQIIASATSQVSGGTTLLRMADLSEVQVRTLVDETDIGKISPGLAATITVDAYPNRQFQGRVLKIEPQSTTNQNVTMFPVLIRIANEEGRLRPGMNAQVEIHVSERRGVLAIPNAALRTQRDVGSAATVLGLDPRVVEQTLARADSQRGPEVARGPTGQSSQGGSAAPTGSVQRPAAAVPAAPAPRREPAPAPTGAAPAPQQGGDQASGARPQGQRQGGGPGGPGGAGGPGGVQMPLPEGVTPEMAAEIRRKRQAGEALTPAESTASAQMREHYQRLRDSGQMPSFGGPGGQQGGQRQGAPQQGGTPPVAQQPGAAPGGQPQGGGAGAFQLPSGVTQEMMTAIFTKMRNGQQLTAAEQAVMTRMRAQMSGGSNRRRFGANNSFQFGGSYIVFVLRDGQPAPVRIRTGVTDLDYSEVVSGLTEQDTVLLLPSASLLNQQAEFRERMQRMTGGGAVPGMRQQTPAGPTTQARPGGQGRQ